VGDEGITVFEFDGSGSTDLDLPNDTLTYAWDFGGDGTSTDVSPNHVFSDEGLYTVSLTVTDGDGTTSVDSSIVIDVNNVAPTATLSGDASIDEGGTYSLTIDDIFDPSGDTLPAGSGLTVDWGDDTPVEIIPGGFTGPGQVLTHPYDDDTGFDGAITVSVVDNGENFENVGTLAMTVNNVAPVGTAFSGGAVDEGSVGQVFLLGVFDPAAGAGDTILIDFGRDHQCAAERRRWGSDDDFDDNRRQ
jgi:PKD repeat protein